MSYIIKVRVIQFDPVKWFSIVEKTVWHDANGGTWVECDGEQILTLGGSDTSGTLRFKNPKGEYFLVALGIHKNEHWCDILPDLSPISTGLQIHPEYYDGKLSNELSQHAGEVEKKTPKGPTVTVKYLKEGDHKLSAAITIKY